MADVASLGAGVIGASWTALFLAAGHRVAIYDPMDGAEKSVRDYVANAWPNLERLGLRCGICSDRRDLRAGKRA